MAVFVLSILIVPIIFSFQDEPKDRHLAHLDRMWVDKLTNSVIDIVQYKRPWVYSVTLLILVVGLIGVQRLKNESRVVDDLPVDDPVMQDLRFFEQEFKGIMPLEIMVDTRKNGGALREASLKRISQLQDTMAKYPEFSRSLSIADAVKFIRQSFYSGEPSRYGLIKSSEKSFILPYLEGAQDKGGMARAFLDDERRTTRISLQMADVGTARMDGIVAKLRTQVDSIFDPSKYRVVLTGASVIFLEGSKYMVKNLIISLIWAVIIISALMALLFNSARMVVVLSLIHI